MKPEKKIKSILSELSGEKRIKNSARLQEDLALDSLSMVTLLIEIEEQLGIELDEKDMNPFDLVTVSDAIRLAERYIGDKNEKVR